MASDMWIVLANRPSSTCGAIAALLTGLACGGDSTAAPSRLDGVWITALANASTPDSVRVVIAQYSDYLRGDAVFASGTTARFAVVGSFIDSDVELDFFRLPTFSPTQQAEFLFRGSYRNGRISGQVTGGARDGSIALVPWKPNVAGIPGSYVLATLDGAPIATVTPGIHDTLAFATDGQLTRARYTPSLSFEIRGIYERKASSVIVRYLSPFFDFAIPQRDSLIIRGATLVRTTSTGSGAAEEAYRRLP